MPSHLYRIRSSYALLDGFHELEKQEIYFASPDELNDPMEGLADTFWRGDEILWKNFFRHYIGCFERAYALFLLGGEEHPIEWKSIPIVSFNEIARTPLHKKLHDEIFSEFYSEPSIRKYLSRISAANMRLRRHQLLAHLRSLHPIVFSQVQRCYESQSLIPAGSFNPKLYKKLLSRVEHLCTVIDLLPEISKNQMESDYENAAEMLFNFQNESLTEIDLLHFHNKTIDSNLKNRNLALIDFPSGYVSRLDLLNRSPWYVACFMENCKNSALWSHYGDHHKGICLRFRADKISGRISLNVQKQLGLNNAGPTIGWQPMDFKKVCYSNKLTEFDFFSCLRAILPVPTLNRAWYYDDDKSPAQVTDIYSEDIAAWRERYFSDLEASFVRKDKDWEFENEYRLILRSLINDFANPESRKLKYDFNDLDAIIFGIKTPMADKLAISKIIETKCRSYSRTDFRFYQSYYSPKTNQMDIYELKLLKFKFP